MNPLTRSPVRTILPSQSPLTIKRESSNGVLCKVYSKKTHTVIPSSTLNLSVPKKFSRARRNSRVEIEVIFIERDVSGSIEESSSESLRDVRNKSGIGKSGSLMVRRNIKPIVCQRGIIGACAEELRGRGIGCGDKRCNTDESAGNELDEHG